MDLYLTGKYGLDVPSLPPTLQAQMVSSNSLGLSWPGTVGRVYQLQTATNLPATNWLNLGITFSGTGGVLSTNLPIGPAPVRFFRLQVLN
jgi:hypothetical protein